MIRRKLMHFISHASLICLAIFLSMSSALAATEIHIWPIGWSAEMQQYVNERVLPEFQEKHPGVEVVITPVTWEENSAKLTVATAAGNAPDIFTTGGTTVVNYVPRGLLQPLDPFLETWDDYHLVYPGAWDNARWEGKIYSVPFTVDLRLVAYHKDIFSEVGLDPESPLRSWEELETAAHLTRKTVGDTVVRRGITLPTAFGSAAVSQRFGQFLMQAGGRLISDDSKTPLFNDEIGHETLTYLKRLYDIGHPPGFNAPPSTGVGAFAAQQIAINPSAAYTTPDNLMRENPDLVNQIGAFPPRKSPEDPEVALAFVNGLGIPAASKHPELAWDFLAHLLAHDHARAFVELNGYMMPRVDLADWIQENRPALIPWFFAMDYVRSWPQIPGPYATLGDWVARALLGEVAPGIALEAAELEQQAVLDDYWARINAR